MIWGCNGSNTRALAIDCEGRWRRQQGQPPDAGQCISQPCTPTPQPQQTRGHQDWHAGRFHPCTRHRRRQGGAASGEAASACLSPAPSLPMLAIGHACNPSVVSQQRGNSHVKLRSITGIRREPGASGQRAKIARRPGAAAGPPMGNSRAGLPASTAAAWSGCQTESSAGTPGASLLGGRRLILLLRRRLLWLLAVVRRCRLELCLKLLQDRRQEGCGHSSFERAC